MTKKKIVILYIKSSTKKHIYIYNIGLIYASSFTAIINYLILKIVPINSSFL